MTDGQPARLTLHAMRFYGRVGHTQEERIVGTHVEVDVELTIRLGKGPADALSRTVDYRSVHDVVRAIVETGEHPLLEGLCAEVLDALEKLPWGHAVVRVRKPSPPFDGHVGYAQVEMERIRS